MLFTKGQMISKELLVSSNSPKKWTNEFIFNTTTNLFVRFLGEFKDTKKSFRNYLTFKTHVQNETDPEKKYLLNFLVLVSSKTNLTVDTYF